MTTKMTVSCQDEDKGVGRGERVKTPDSVLPRAFLVYLVVLAIGTGTRTGKKEEFPSQCQSGQHTHTQAELYHHCRAHASRCQTILFQEGQQDTGAATTNSKPSPSQIHRNNRPATTKTHVAAKFLLGTDSLSRRLGPLSTRCPYLEETSSRCKWRGCCPLSRIRCCLGHAASCARSSWKLCRQQIVCAKSPLPLLPQEKVLPLLE